MFECVVHTNTTPVGHRVAVMMSFMTMTPARPDLALRACALVCGLPVAPVLPAADVELFDRVSRGIIGSTLSMAPEADSDVHTGSSDHGAALSEHEQLEAYVYLWGSCVDCVIVSTPLAMSAALL
jgi:hypothetical protein